MPQQSIFFPFDLKENMFPPLPSMFCGVSPMLTSSLQILGQMKKQLCRIVTLVDFIRLCDLCCL